MAPEVLAKIATVRQKMIEGTATLEELREAVTLMRGDRKIATTSLPAGGKRSAAKPKAQIGSVDEMLNELGNI